MAALQCGDASAVQMMYIMLLPFAAIINFPSSSLKQQLEREYAIKLYESSSEWEAATTPNGQASLRNNNVHDKDEASD
jgi:hypothetical protein